MGSNGRMRAAVASRPTQPPGLRDGTETIWGESRGLGENLSLGAGVKGDGVGRRPRGVLLAIKCG